jgi:hypothetical protein
MDWRRILSIFRRRPGMTGIPPSLRQVPVEARRHALDFSHRYAEPMNYHVENRMMELGIPMGQIGAATHGKPHRAFWPEETTGGGNAPGGRLTVDSGDVDGELIKDLGPQVSSRWEKSRLRDRLDAIIAHEYAEAHGATHEEAVARAAQTDLPISARARRLLRDIAQGGMQR